MNNVCDVLGEKVSLNSKVELFNKWFLNSSISISKIVAITHPIYRISVAVSDNISFDEIYLSVSSQVIIDSDKAFEDKYFGVLIKSLQQKYRVRDDFHELLLFVMYQYFMIREKSFFWPYLTLLPTAAELDIPTLWSRDIISSRLSSSQIKAQILAYVDKTEKMYIKLTEIELITSFFKDKDIFSLQNYKWLSAILDSRSIWWEGKRHLVPMLDFVNCQHKDHLTHSPYRVHTTGLSDDKKYAETRAGYYNYIFSLSIFASYPLYIVANFKVNEEVFENYGQPNHIYFMYHGFSIENNNHDCVHMDFFLNNEEISRVDWEFIDATAKVISVYFNCIIFYSFKTCINVL
jgi:histone-lysine N-methyltransferase SETD3